MKNKNAEASKSTNQSMQRWLTQAMRGDFAAKLGAKNWTIKPGYCSCELAVKDKHLNLNRVLHGGVIYSIADTGMGGALAGTLGKNEICATVEMKINYLAGITGGIIKQETRMVHRGKRFAVFISEVRDENKRLLAIATGTFAIMKRRRNS